MEDSEGLPSDLIDDMGMRDERRAGMNTERERARRPARPAQAQGSAGQLTHPKPAHHTRAAQSQRHLYPPDTDIWREWLTETVRRHGLMLSRQQPTLGANCCSEELPGSSWYQRGQPDRFPPGRLAREALQGKGQTTEVANT